MSQSIEPEHVWCGTSVDANLADCEILLTIEEVWNEKAERWLQSQIFGSYEIADRVACNGACCVFFHDGDQSSMKNITTVRQEALALLRCGNTEFGLVNGLGLFVEGNDMNRHGTCLANMNGVSDCFTGKDFKDSL